MEEYEEQLPEMAARLKTLEAEIEDLKREAARSGWRA